MSETSARKLAALRAMANQDSSPVERDIAREKLRRLASLQAVHWTHEQREAQRVADAIKADEDARAELLRRWERGDFRGVTTTVGSKREVRYRRSA